MYKPIESWILNQAAYYLEYSHYDKAIALLQALELIDQSNLDTYKMLAYVYLKKHNFKESINLANKYIINTNNAEDIKKMEWLKKYAVFKMKSKQNSNKNLTIKQHL
jgi:tetratricopeptide (TPR) repeat protein